VIARALAAVGLLAGPAFADGSAPDPRAQQAGEDANLESNAPRTGMTFSFSLGGGLIFGDRSTSTTASTGVGRGPSVSFRVGHVATRDTVITFELTGGSRLYSAGVSGAPTLHDDDFNLMAGALTYVAPSLWLRGAGGLAVATDDGTMPHAGVSGLAGVGVDFVRWHQLVLGLEAWGILSVVATKGAVFDTGLCLGLTSY